MLQLRIEEELKGNVKNKVLHETARKTIADKFYDTYGVRHPWIKFRNKFNSCKKQYGAMKRLTHWMRIPDAASVHSDWMQQSDVVRSRFWKFWIMRLEIVSGYSIGRQFSFKTEFTNL